MRSKADDRRVKYTKMVLKESFISKLEQKDISQITIKEICEDADINRATFYAHYNDQYDLLRKIENELIDNIKAHLDQLDPKFEHSNAIIMVEKIFDYLKENVRLCKLLLSDRGDFNFQKEVMGLVYDIILSKLNNNDKISKEDTEYIYSFAITGCVGVVQKWLDSDMKKSPRLMSEMVVKLSRSIYW